MSDVFLKRVDRRLCSRLKVEAAARGKTVGEMFNEAVRLWLMVQQSRDIENERNLEAYLQIKKELTKHPGEYFVIAKGTRWFTTIGVTNMLRTGSDGRLKSMA